MRNGYGRQFHSGTFALAVEPAYCDQLPDGTPATFLRAPRIARVGDGCAALARRDGDPVLVQQGNVLGACLYPELQDDHPVARRLAAIVAAAAPARGTA